MQKSASRTSDALESFRRVRGDQLVERFYQIFLDSDQQVRSLFARTDLAQQKLMLHHGLFMLLRFACGDAVGSLALKRLGHRHHVELGVPASLYKNFVDCLVQAASELDSEWSARLEQSWRANLEIGIAEMARYAE